MTIEYLRQFRIFGYAIFDFAVTFIAAAIFAPLLSKLFLKCKIDIPKINWLFLSIPISVLVHLAVGTYTPLTRQFFDPTAHILVKIFILGFLVMGLRNIKRVK